MAVKNVIRYIGDGWIPADVKRRRRYVMDALRRVGTPVVIKHMFNAEDVENGLALPSPNFSAAYGQTRHNDPLSHGVGFISVETSPNEWITPDGDLVTASSSPGVGYTPAPKYRGFGPGYLTYIIEPDVALDMFKLTDTGVLIKAQSATAQAPWFPDMSDNDLLTNVVIDPAENITDTLERYQLKQTNPVSVRGIDRRGRREYTEDGGNRFIINQTFEMSLVPSNDQLYSVEMDR